MSAASACNVPSSSPPSSFGLQYLRDTNFCTTLLLPTRRSPRTTRRTISVGSGGGLVGGSGCGSSGGGAGGSSLSVVPRLPIKIDPGRIRSRDRRSCWILEDIIRLWWASYLPRWRGNDRLLRVHAGIQASNEKPAQDVLVLKREYIPIIQINIDDMPLLIPFCRGIQKYK